MHKFAGWLPAVFVAAGMPALEPSHPPPGYSLVFADDFSGARLDESRWMYRMDVKMDSSQRPENVFLRDGKLVIALRKEEHRGKGYTGGGVISRRSFRYGYFEARVKMHAGAGLAPVGVGHDGIAGNHLPRRDAHRN